MKSLISKIKEPKNLFAKIVFGVVLLSFGFLGVSELFVGNQDSWIVKIGDVKISRSFFEKTVEMDREIIRASQPNNQKVAEYIASEAFRSDVLSRIIRKNIISQVSEEIGITPSEKFILQSVAKDQNFHDEKGKFVQKKFHDFLAKNGLDETRYVKEVSSEVAAEIILQSMAMAAPSNFKLISEIENFNQEQRVADIIKITKNDVKYNSKLSDGDLEKFYDENKSNYRLAETRKVVFFELEKDFFDVKTAIISDDEIKAEYEKNKTRFVSKENRDFYHLPFSSKEKAEEFIKILSNFSQDEQKLKAEFMNLALKNAKKTAKEITFNKITKEELPESISAAVFALKKGELSKVVESQIGFHLFLVNEINSERPISFAEAKSQIKSELLAARQDNATQKKIDEMNNALLSSEKLEQVAEKFAIKFDKEPLLIDLNGVGVNSKPIEKIASLKNFSKIAFDLKTGQISKLIANGDKSYAIQVLEVIPAHQREFLEVKEIVAFDAEEKAKIEGVAALAKMIYGELKNNPSAFASIAAKNHLKVEKNRSFPRNFMLDLGGGSMPYKNKFLQELFGKKIGEITEASESDQGVYVIAILRSIKKANLSSQDLIKIRKSAIEGFVGEVMHDYNEYLQAKYPVEINKSFFKKEAAQ